MQLPNILFKILKSYNVYIFIIIFFEIYYYIKKYKGFKFNISKNKTMTDDIPCPYYFMFKILKVLKKKKFKSCVDLGCGSGRIIDFINKNFTNKKLVGIEYFDQQYNYSKKIFEKSKNISIIQSDFTKLNLRRNIYDIYFISAPFKNKKDFLKFMKKFTKIEKIKKKIIIVINYEKKLLQKVNKLRFIDSFYLSEDKGYSICLI